MEDTEGEFEKLGFGEFDEIDVFKYCILQLTNLEKYCILLWY